jgi:hypothetical protein
LRIEPRNTSPAQPSGSLSPESNATPRAALAERHPTAQLPLGGQPMIVKRKAGYYVLSERTRKTLGGPYKSRAAAAKRLRAVEYFKHAKRK